MHGIHQRVGRHLWALLTEETQLAEHLRALRDYFLCCRGDFYAHFLELTANVLAVDIKVLPTGDRCEGFGTCLNLLNPAPPPLTIPPPPLNYSHRGLGIVEG